MATLSRNSFAPLEVRRPQQRKDTDSEGDVGGHRNTPPAPRFPTTGHGHAHQRRENDTAGSGQRGQRRRTAVTQLPHDQLPLDLQADDEEEQDHHSVIDPVPQVVGHPRRSATEADLLLPELDVAVCRRAVRPHQRAHCGNDQDDPARTLRVQERPQRGSDRSRHASDRTSHAFRRLPAHDGHAARDGRARGSPRLSQRSPAAAPRPTGLGGLGPIAESSSYASNPTACSWATGPLSRHGRPTGPAGSVRRVVDPASYRVPVPL